MESARIGEQREAEPRKGRPPLGVYCGGAVCAARRGAVAAWERSVGEMTVGCGGRAAGYEEPTAEDESQGIQIRSLLWWAPLDNHGI